MELNRQQRVGMAVAAIALAALGVDQFVLGGGGPATASAQVGAPGILPVSAVQDARQEASSMLALRLDEFAASERVDPSAGVPDVFGGSQWRITAVVGLGQRGAVRIDDELVRVGQVYNGAVLTSVSRTGAVFTKAGREINVSIDGPESGKGR